MADIVLGIGTSHGPTLSTPPEQWGQRVAADKKNPRLFFRGQPYDFDALLELRKDENIADQLSVEIWREKHRRCMTAIARLADIFEEVSPDVAVIFGNDQREQFVASNMPTFTVYWGDTIENIPFSERQKELCPPGIAIAESGHTGPRRDVYPGCSDLALHIIKSLIAEEFDIATSNALPNLPDHWWSGIQHAFGFVYRQIMRDNPVPSVPLMTNTFFPPNQPPVRRCLKYGKAIRRAIETWDSDQRVVVFGSGGLSHFVIDEDFDERLLGALSSDDETTLALLPDSYFQSGTSECKNWVPMAGIFGGSDFKMEIVDYVPCYRSAAGTGTANGFAYWQRG